MINFSVYPDGIFKGVVKLILYTIIPVGLVNYLPHKIMIQFDLIDFMIIMGFTALILFLAFVIFYRGLKRYTSSSLMIARI